eukprot:6531537-Pyramimonas_sp.AAC.1
MKEWADMMKKDFNEDYEKRPEIDCKSRIHPLSPEELYELIPPVCPVTHQVKGCVLTAKYPVDV